MTEEKWKNQWREMKRKVDEDPCPEFGMDLFEGRLFSGRPLPDLQVFGKEIFLRNVLQRVLDADFHFRYDGAPIFVIVPPGKKDLLPGVNKMFVDKDPEGSCTLFLYESGQPRCSVSPEKFISLLDPDGIEQLFGPTRQIHLFAVLGADEERPLNNPMLFRLKKTIREHFRPEFITDFRPRCPYIYLFHPEDMGLFEDVRKWIDSLRPYCLFRIFLKELRPFIDQSITSLIYGPDLYLLASYEDMLRRVSKWHRKKTYIPWGNRETAMRLKTLRMFASEIPLNQTGFALFKNTDDEEYDYVWFYPSQQSLGSLPYQPPDVQFQSNNETKPVTQPTPAKDFLTEVINDLKAKQN